MAAKEMKLSTYIRNFQILILYKWDSLSTINIYFFLNYANRKSFSVVLNKENQNIETVVRI